MQEAGTCAQLCERSQVLGIALAVGFIYIPIHTMVFLDPETVVESFVHTTGGHP